MCSLSLIKILSSDASPSDVTNRLIQKILGNSEEVRNLYEYGILTAVLSNKQGNLGGYYLGKRIRSTPECILELLNLTEGSDSLRIVEESGYICLYQNSNLTRKVNSNYPTRVTPLEEAIYNVAGYISEGSIPIHQVSIIKQGGNSYYMGYANAVESVFPEECSDVGFSREYSVLFLV